MKDMPKPLNAEEKYLYGIIERLDKLIEVLENNKDINIEEPITEKTKEVEEVAPPTSENLPYDDMTKAELVEILTERNVECNKKWRKDELLELAKNSE